MLSGGDTVPMTAQHGGKRHKTKHSVHPHLSQDDKRLLAKVYAESIASSMKARANPTTELTPEERANFRATAEAVVNAKTDEILAGRGIIDKNSIDLNDPRFSTFDKALIEVERSNGQEEAKSNKITDEAVIKAAGEDAAREKAYEILKRQHHSKKIVVKQENFSKLPTSLKNEIAHVATKEVRTEFYKLHDEESDVKTKIQKMLKERLHRLTTAGPKWKIKYFNNIQAYTKQRMNLWNTSIDVKRSAPIFPTLKDGERQQSEIITEFHRYVHILPITTSSIVLIPAVKGITSASIILNKLIELKLVIHVTHNGKETFNIKRDVILIFMPNFYPSFLENSKNKIPILFSLFLDLYRHNPNQVFILSTSDPENELAGSYLTKMFADSNGPIGKPILSMLEPSYIIYPYPRKDLKNGILISGSSEIEDVNLPEDVNDDNNEILQDKTLYMNPRYGDRLGLLLKPKVILNNKLKEADHDIFTIRGKYQNGTQLQLAETGGANCKDLLESESLDKYVVNGKKIILNHNPVTADFDILLVIQLGAGQALLCNSTDSIEPLALHKSDKFVATPTAFNGEVVQLTLSGLVYSIRDPRSAIEIWSDWMNPGMPVLTEDEANFLNALNLRPKILQKMYEGDRKPWTEHLSDFMHTLVVSNCLTDQSLLMKRECNSCRDFLHRAKQFFVDNSFEIDLVRDEQEREAREKYRKYADEVLYSEDNHDSKTQYGIEPDDLKELDAKGVDKTKMNEKRILGDLDLYNDAINNTVNAIIIGVNNKKRTHKFYEISVPTKAGDDVEVHRQAILEKVESLRAKYPDYIFFF